MTITLFARTPHTPPAPRCTCCQARLGYEAKSLADLGHIMVCDQCLFRLAIERLEQLYGSDVVPCAERAACA